MRWGCRVDVMHWGRSRFPSPRCEIKLFKVPGGASRIVHRTSLPGVKSDHDTRVPTLTHLVNCCTVSGQFWRVFALMLRRLFEDPPAMGKGV